MDRIRGEGHLTGNHSYSHPDGWKTKTSVYLKDADNASDLTSGKVFRPPFGRLSKNQYRMLLKSFKIILWDIMPYDFDAAFGSERTLNILKDKIRPGSIIVLHDNTASCADVILEDFIIYALKRGYSFNLPDF